MGLRRASSNNIILRGYARPLLLLVPLLLVYGVWIGGVPGRISPPAGQEEVQGQFMWYAPHSGFSNQVVELKNALRVAAILGRILVLPPVTDHHALSLGSCPKYRIVDPPQLRAAALSHFSELVAESRFYSIADVVNISAVSPRFVKTIDFRVFALLWCGADVRSACAGPLCHELANRLARPGTDLRHCGKLLTAAGQGVCDVDDNCATTVWSYSRRALSTRKLMQTHSKSKLKMRKYEGLQRVKRDIHESLGSHTDAGKAKVLAFGSLFSADYQGAQTHVDFSAASGDEKFDRMFEASQQLPLSREIVEAGMEYIERRLGKQDYFCAQLRLLDGQFKNHWSKTFNSLRSRLEADASIKAIFLMTDLPRTNWTGTYLDELSNNKRFRLYLLDETDELVAATARKILASELGIKSGILPHGLNQDQAPAIQRQHIHVPNQMLPEILLYLQEAICSCAALGFQGTAGSTISETILQMKCNAL